MPLKENEPRPTTILMRVVNPHAPHFGEQGFIVNTEGEGDALIIVLDFGEGKPERYARIELELVIV